MVSSDIMVIIAALGDPDSPYIQVISAPGLAEKLQVTERGSLTVIVTSGGSTVTDGRAGIYNQS